MAQKTVYIPDNLAGKWESIPNKSEWIQQRLQNKEVTKSELMKAVNNAVELLSYYEDLDSNKKIEFTEAATNLITKL